MKCGNLTVNAEGRITGSFLSWAYPRIDFALRENKDRRSDKAPSHEVIAKSPHGDWVTIGAAWQNKVKRGENAGADCYSLLFEEPTAFETPVKLSAWHDTGDTYYLEFDKSEQEVVAQAA